MWKNRAGTCSTHRNLLKICVKGEWHDSAMIIVGLFKDSVGKLYSFNIYFSHYRTFHSTYSLVGDNLY